MIQRPRLSQYWGFFLFCFYIVASSETVKRNVSATNVNLRQYDKKKNSSPSPFLFSSHAPVLNLHYFSLCQLMCMCLICWMFRFLLFAQNGAPKQKRPESSPPRVRPFILTVHFILENWLLFWYNCGLHEKSSAEKLIFLCKCCKCTYCSCVMLYD